MGVHITIRRHSRRAGDRDRRSPDHKFEPARHRRRTTLSRTLSSLSFSARHARTRKECCPTAGALLLRFRLDRGLSCGRGGLPQAWAAQLSECIRKQRLRGKCGARAGRGYADGRGESEQQQRRRCGSSRRLEECQRCRERPQELILSTSGACRSDHPCNDLRPAPPLTSACYRMDGRDDRDGAKGDAASDRLQGDGCE